MKSPKSKPKPAAPPPAAPAVAERPANRPPFEPTQVQRETVTLLTAGGFPKEAVAGVLRISVNTLRKYFRRELDLGHVEVGLLVVAEHLKKIRSGDMNAIKWWEQSRLGWTERVVLVDGGTEVDPRTLSDKELADRQAKLAGHPAVQRATKLNVLALRG